MDRDKCVLDELLSEEQAIIIRAIIHGLIAPCKNPQARAYGLIFAAGLDKANAIPSQAAVAREIGCSRALISHYTTEWAEKIRNGFFYNSFNEKEPARMSQIPKEQVAAKQEGTMKPANQEKQPIPNMPTLVDAIGLAEALCPDPRSRPCLRTIRRWQKMRLIPFLKIGGKVMFDPVQVRRALDARFTIKPL